MVDICDISINMGDISINMGDICDIYIVVTVSR